MIVNIRFGLRRTALLLFVCVACAALAVWYFIRSNTGVEGKTFGSVLTQCVYRSFYSVESYTKTVHIANLSFFCEESAGFFDRTYPTDKCSEHGYLYIYDGLFRRFRQRDIILFEAGVKNGGSIKLWRDYFSHGSRIFGLDVNPGMSTFVRDPNIKILYGDSKWAKFPFFETTCIDIFIDDAYHSNSPQIETLLNWYEHICLGGLYIIEDVVDKQSMAASLAAYALRFEVFDDKSGQYLFVIYKN